MSTPNKASQQRQRKKRAASTHSALLRSRLLAALGERMTESEQAVVVEFNYGLDSTDEIFALEDQLEAAIENAGVGDFDGDEIAADLSDGFLYMYGPDADAVFKVIEPILKSVSFMRGAKVKLVYGELGEDVPRKIIEIS